MNMSRYRLKILSLPCTFLVALLIFWTPAQLMADSPDHAEIQQIQYFQSTKNLTPEDAFRHFSTKPYKTLSGNIFNIGLDRGRYWLKIDLDQNTKRLQPVRLVSTVPFRQLLTVYLVQNNRFSKILDSRNTQTYTQRSNNFRFLNTRPFFISNKSPASLLINYSVIGSSYLPLRLLSEQQFNDLQINDTSHSTTFYSFSLATIFAFLMFALAMKDTISLLYGLLFSIGLLFIASMEGFGFKHLWPDLPTWNHYATLVTGYGLCALGFYTASKASLTDQLSITIKKVTFYLSLFSLLLIPAVFILNFVLLAQIANLLLALMFIAHGWISFSWAKAEPANNRLTLIIVLPLAVFVTAVILFSFNTSMLPVSFYISATRVIYLVATLAIMITIIMNVASLSRQHEQALKNELALSIREAEKSRQLLQAQKDYTKAQQLARLRQEQLASASHDMKQPLVSLRSTIDAVVTNAAPEVKQQLHNAVDYLSNLCNQYLDDTTPQDVATDDHDTSIASGTERYPVNLLLETVVKMFSSEAEDKNLQLKYQPSSLYIEQPTTVMMRILSNLVGNAIKHTETGKILVGVRREVHGLRLLVCDSGKGMTGEQLETLSKAYQKGPDSEGHGLGLAIVQQLAEQHNMQFDIRSKPGHGTCCSLKITY